MSGFVSGPIEQRVFRNGWRDVFGIFVLAPLAIIAAAAVVCFFIGVVFAVGVYSAHFGAWLLGVSA